jgi:hypothetical protein
MLKMQELLGELIEPFAQCQKPHRVPRRDHAVRTSRKAPASLPGP